MYDFFSFSVHKILFIVENIKYFAELFFLAILFVIDQLLDAKDEF